MLKTLIVDDESHCIERLIHLIERHPNTFEVVATCDSVERALEAVANTKPDLVFLDIEIHDKTGFDFLKQAKKTDFKIIFTTAFDSYAIKAFKFSAFDYLLKPIDIDDFNNTIIRLKKETRQKTLEGQLENLFRNLNPDQNKIITIPSVSGFETIKLEDIIHFEANTSYTYIYTEKERKLVSKPLKFYEDLLNEQRFFKTHKSHIINIDFVKTYHKGKQSYVTMTNNSHIPVSVRRKEAFLKLFL